MHRWRHNGAKHGLRKKLGGESARDLASDLRQGSLDLLLGQVSSVLRYDLRASTTRIIELKYAASHFTHKNLSTAHALLCRRFQLSTVNMIHT